MNSIDSPRIKVDAALSSGVGMCFDKVAQKTTGRVFTPPPFRKSVTTTSLKENVNESNAAETIPGQMFGRVTRRKVVISSAPRLIAAFSIERSNSRRLKINTTQTLGLQHETWHKMIIELP